MSYQMIIRELYGEPVDLDSSREHRSMSELYMEAHCKRLATFIDTLSTHMAGSIDKMFVDLLLKRDPPKTRAMNAATVYAWHAIFSPFHEKTSYVDERRLLPLIHANGEALHTYAVFTIGGLDEAIWREMRLLNPSLAADYFKYSLMFAYRNLTNEDIVKYVKLEADTDVRNTFFHLRETDGARRASPA